MSETELLHLIAVYGYWAILVGVAVDSFGVPVPGEVMLLSASVYAGTSHRLQVTLVIAAAALGGVCGDNTSFLLGREGGERLLRRFGYLIRLGERRRRLAQYLFQRHGGVLVIGGRFIPIVHIWTAFLAGTHGLPWYRFVVLNAIACVAWASFMGMAGYVWGTTAVHLGGTILALSIPIAVAITGVVLLLVRLMEQRWQIEADKI